MCQDRNAAWGSFCSWHFGTGWACLWVARLKFGRWHKGGGSIHSIHSIHGIPRHSLAACDQGWACVNSWNPNGPSRWYTTSVARLEVGKKVSSAGNPQNSGQDTDALWHQYGIQPRPHLTPQKNEVFLKLVWHLVHLSTEILDPCVCQFRISPNAFWPLKCESEPIARGLFDCQLCDVLLRRLAGHKTHRVFQRAFLRFPAASSLFLFNWRYWRACMQMSKFCRKDGLCARQCKAGP